MKIYFAGSIRGGRGDQELYMEIIKVLQTYGEVLTEHVGNKDLSSYGESTMSNKEIYERDMSWLRESDVIVAEVTCVSLGVGYELGQSEALGKKVICLYRPSPDKKLSAMISGNSKMEVVEYQKLEDLKPVFEEKLKS